MSCRRRVFEDHATLVPCRPMYLSWRKLDCMGGSKPDKPNDQPTILRETYRIILNGSDSSRVGDSIKKLRKQIYKAAGQRKLCLACRAADRSRPTPQPSINLHWALWPTLEARTSVHLKWRMHSNLNLTATLVMKNATCDGLLQQRTDGYRYLTCLTIILRKKILHRIVCHFI